MNAPVRLFVTPERVKLTVDDFLLLNDHGAFADYTKTELIDGEIFGVNAQHTRHARTKSRLYLLIELRLREMGSDLEAITEPTMRAGRHSAPEPDIVLTRFTGDREVPVETVALAVEVADTTLATDLGRKAGLYAEVGVPEYWVVDIAAARVVIQSLPVDGAYSRRMEVEIGGVLAAVTIPGLAVATDDLLR